MYTIHCIAFKVKIGHWSDAYHLISSTIYKFHIFGLLEFYLPAIFGKPCELRWSLGPD